MNNFYYKYFIKHIESVDENNVKVFTYEDYTYYSRRLFKIDGLREPNEEYVLNKIHQYKDKGYKIVLSNKNEAIQLINKALKIENTQYALKENEIEEYNSSFITPSFKSKESDIVYKKKDKDIFFLIEHQSKVDYSMPYRILNYCVQIMNSAVLTNRILKKDYKIPNVYAIVLYTGKTKWNPKKYIQECQETLEGAKAQGFGSYNLIDINEYTEDELWKENNFLSKMLLLEKAKINKEVYGYVDKIKNENLSKEQLDIIIQMIYNSLDRKAGKEAVQELIKKMKERKGGNIMSAFEEYLDSLFDKGMEKGIKEIVIRMLQNNMEENTIKLMTQITQEELEEIKKELQLVAN